MSSRPRGAGWSSEVLTSAMAASMEASSRAAAVSGIHSLDSTTAGLPSMRTLKSEALSPVIGLPRSSVTRVSTMIRSTVMRSWTWALACTANSSAIRTRRIVPDYRAVTGFMLSKRLRSMRVRYGSMAAKAGCLSTMTVIVFAPL